MKYAVIGGQYEKCCYGVFDSLQGAKICATKNEEYWDNWQGWNTPKIYDFDDTMEIESKGRITTCDGVMVRLPKPDATPLFYKNNGKWEEYN